MQHSIHYEQSIAHASCACVYAETGRVAGRCCNAVLWGRAVGAAITAAAPVSSYQSCAKQGCQEARQALMLPAHSSCFQQCCPADVASAFVVVLFGRLYSGKLFCSHSLFFSTITLGTMFVYNMLGVWRGGSGVRQQGWCLVTS